MEGVLEGENREDIDIVGVNDLPVVGLEVKLPSIPGLGVVKEESDGGATLPLPHADGSPEKVRV